MNAYLRNEFAKAENILKQPGMQTNVLINEAVQTMLEITGNEYYEIAVKYKLFNVSHYRRIGVPDMRTDSAGPAKESVHEAISLNNTVYFTP